MPQNIMPETDEKPPVTIPATPSAIAQELEPLIERATRAAADYVLSHIEARLLKIEHQLQLAAKHDAMLMTEIMDLKLRMDNHADRIERLEAQIRLNKSALMLPPNLNVKTGKRRKARK